MVRIRLVRRSMGLEVKSDTALTYPTYSAISAIYQHQMIDEKSDENIRMGRFCAWWTEIIEFESLILCH